MWHQWLFVIDGVAPGVQVSALAVSNVLVQPVNADDGSVADFIPIEGGSSEMVIEADSKKSKKDTCYRCGSSGHFFYECRENI
jgi:hypothetical protein